MKRREAVALVSALALAACADAGTGTAPMAAADGARGARSSHVTLPGTVDGMIDVLFRGGNVTAAHARWSTVLRFDLAGDRESAYRQMVLLAEFALAKQRQHQLRDPDGEGAADVQDGVNQLLRLMFGEIFPGQPLAPGSDVVIALVDHRPRTVVTPSRHAGFQIDANGTPEPFVLVIDRDDSPYAPCSGPLATTLCQFPLFYRFTPFPDTRLTRKARFGVCTYEEGHPKGPADSAQHHRMRLAHDIGDHDVPDDAIVHEGVEILPPATVNFLECEDLQLPPISVIDGLAATNPLLGAGLHALRLLGDALTPGIAHAIDRGGGGEADFFSPFNAVDYLTGTYDGPFLEGPVLVAPGGKGTPKRP